MCLCSSPYATALGNRCPFPPRICRESRRVIKKKSRPHRDGISSRGTTLIARLRRTTLSGHQHAPSLLTGDDPGPAYLPPIGSGFSWRLRRDFRLGSVHLLPPDQARFAPTPSYSSPSQPFVWKTYHTGFFSVNIVGMRFQQAHAPNSVCFWVFTFTGLHFSWPFRPMPCHQWRPPLRRRRRYSNWVSCMPKFRCSSACSPLSSHHLK